MTAIYAETPFQLTLGLNIACNYLRAEQIVLFVVQEMYESCNLFSVSNKCKNVKEVYIVKRTSKSVCFLRRQALRIQYGMLSPLAYIMPKLPKRTIKIDSVIGTRYSNAIPLILQLLKEKASLYLIEEGIGEYVDGIKNDTQIDPIWLHSDTISSCMRVFMFPRYFQCVNGLLALQAPVVDETFRFILNSILPPISQHEQNEWNNRKIIYFDTPIYSNVSDAFVQKMGEIADFLMKTVDLASNTIIKRHPRSMINYTLIDNVFVSNTAWEYAMANLVSDIENKIIICDLSTVALTPKGLFGKEPYIICTALMYKHMWREVLGEDQYEDYFSVIKEIKKMYNMSDRIAFPTDFDEFKIVLRDFQNG